MIMLYFGTVSGRQSPAPVSLPRQEEHLNQSTDFGFSQTRSSLFQSDDGDYFLITLPVFGRARNQTAHSLGDDGPATNGNSNKKSCLCKLLLAIIIKYVRWMAANVGLSTLYIFFFITKRR